MTISIPDHSVAQIPEAVARVAAVMSRYPAPWALCGGWAVDGWLGKNSRDHGDVDIVIFLDDRQAFFEHMAGWQLVAHDPTVPGDTAEPWNGRALTLPAHIHARSPELRTTMPERVDNAAGQGFGLDVQLNDRSGGDWVLNHEPPITVPLGRCVQQSPWGLPAVVPEVLLFYKAGDLRRRDRLDFLTLLPRLTAEQRDWLQNAIALVGHPWLAQLRA